jgi:uncharacterized membrane protein YgcG
MIKSLISILALGGLSFFYTDIESTSLLLSILLPVVVFLSLLALGFWFVALFYKLGIKQTSNNSGDLSGSGFFGGGDSGGGGDAGDC